MSDVKFYSRLKNKLNYCKESFKFLLMTELATLERDARKCEEKTRIKCFTTKLRSQTIVKIVYSGSL